MVVLGEAAELRFGDILEFWKDMKRNEVYVSEVQH